MPACFLTGDSHEEGPSEKTFTEEHRRNRRCGHAPQQDEPHPKRDERTSNKPIGEVAYANRGPTKKKSVKK